MPLTAARPCSQQAVHSLALPGTALGESALVTFSLFLQGGVCNMNMGPRWLAGSALALSESGCPSHICTRASARLPAGQ